MSDDETHEGISDEILTQAENYIKELLKNKRLPQHVRAQLEIQSYFLMFLVQDHERISQVYPFYKAQKLAQERRNKLWDKLQAILIPMAVTGVIAFVSQFIYFWVVIVPKLTP